MTKFEIYLLDEDCDRLYALKEKTGEKHLSGNEFARKLLECEIHRRHPHPVKFDEDGGYIIQ